MMMLTAQTLAYLTDEGSHDICISVQLSDGMISEQEAYP